MKTKLANLLAISVLVLTAGLTSYTQISRIYTNPDISAQSSQEDSVEKLDAISEKAIESTNIPAPVASTRTNTAGFSINLSGKTTSIFTTSSLGTNPGSKVAYYNNQFLFAHSSGPFKSLASADSFQIVRNGQVENYKIIKKVTYCDYSNATQHGAAWDCDARGERKLPALAWGDPANYYDAAGYGVDLILMTCAGQSLPNQDASHRLLAYAVRI